MNIVEIATYIGAVSLILSVMGVMIAKLRPIFAMKDAVRKLYGDNFVDKAQEILDKSIVSDDDYAYICAMYKLYTEKLKADKNGLPWRKMEDIEIRHKKNNIK